MMECLTGQTTDNDLDIDKLSTEINNGQCDITNVIVSLKDFLTVGDAEKRAHGMNTLSMILKKVDRKICSKNHVNCLVEYFIARLGDKSYVIERSIIGLDSLCHFEHFTFQMASSLFFAIQNELPIQMLKPECKSTIYQLIDYLWQRFRDDFISLGANFVYGFLRIVDTETSPICLMIIFPLFGQIAAISSFEMFMEDIFDSMACYFPIIYNSHKKDKYLETKIKLSHLLNEAITANPKCCQYVMPLALEKLESESIESKLSSYRLLQMALPTYSSQDVAKHMAELWISIRIDTLKPKIDDDELADNALATLSKLADVITLECEFQTTLMNKIWADLEISFKTPELQLACSSGRILIAFSGNHVSVFTDFFDRVAPISLQSFIFKTDSDGQTHSLISFLLMMKHGHRIGVNIPAKEACDLMRLLIENSPNKSKELQELVIRILNEYLWLSRFDKDHLMLTIHFAINCVRQSGYDSQLQNACLLLIETLAQQYDGLIYELYVANIMQEIECSTLVDERQMLFLQNILRSSCQSSSSSSTIISIVTFLMDRLVLFTLNNVDHLVYLTNMIGTFRICVSRLSTQQDLFSIADFNKLCISRFLRLLIRTCFIESTTTTAPCPSDVIRQFASLFHHFLLNCSSKDIWQQITDKVWMAFNSKDLRSLYEPDRILSIAVNSSVDIQIELLLHLVYSCLRTCNDNSLNVDYLVELFDQIVSFDLTVYNEEIVQLFSMCLAEIIAKSTDSNILSNLLTKHLETFESSRSQCEPKYYLYLHSIIWMAKSLFRMANNKHLYQYVEKILNSLEQASSSTRNAITGLADVLYSQNDYWQSRHDNDTLVCSSRFSLELHHVFCRHYEQTDDVTVLYILLSHLKYIPVPTDKYVPYIVKGLGAVDSPTISLLCLNFLSKYILSEQPNWIEPQVLTVLGLVIDLAKQSSLLHVRKAALNNIAAMIDLFGEKHLIGLRTQYIQSLRPTLADHKRIVRCSAVKSFFKMSILGQPGSNRTH